MFKKTKKRVARRIGQDEEDKGEGQQASELPAVVKPRPKTRPSPSLRSSFNDDDDAESAHAINAPRKVGLNRVALERAAAERLPIRDTVSDDIYSADHLAQLRTSTPDRPSAAANQRWEEHNLLDRNDAPSDQGELDGISNFGSKSVSFDLTRQEEPYIPSAAEIKEKKERRRRLALEAKAGDQEEDYISLNDTRGSSRRINRATPDSDGDGNVEPRSRSLIIPADEYEHTSKWGESRLVRDDEDIAEGFEEFVDDPGRVVMGVAARKEQEQARRADIEKQIRNAQRVPATERQQNEHDYTSEDDNDDDADDEDIARVRAYEASQTRHGTISGGAHLSAREREKRREERLRRRLHHLPKPRPIPELSEAVEKFRRLVVESQQAVERTRAREQELEREQEEITKEEVRIKELLREAGERFERLKGDTLASEAAAAEHGRGLENLGGMAGMPEDEYNET